MLFSRIGLFEYFYTLQAVLKADAITLGVIVFFRQHHLSVGVSAGAAAGQKHLSQVHQVDAEGEGHFQAGWLQGCVQTVGEAQEQAWYELWDHGQSPEVSFDTEFAKKTIW